MAWPWKFVDLNDQEKQLRRQSLDSYAYIAHLSVFAPIPIYLLSSLVQRVVRKRLRGRANESGGEYQQVPGSPLVKAMHMTASGELASRWRKFKWWMADEIYILGKYRGKRDEWILGAVWLAWLLALCVKGTGNDYLHLTKRFGIIAVSQMPAQYLMTLKSLNLFAYIFRSSHEEVNRYHRVLSRLIIALLSLHFAFYNYFFYAKGIWLKRYSEPIVIYGAAGALGIYLLLATALPVVRSFSYRIFFNTHLIVGTTLPFLIFFHASSSRFYLLESCAAFFLDLMARKFTTVNAPAKLETVPGTDLFKVVATIPGRKMESFRTKPASHVYINVPADSRPTPKTSANSAFETMYNPFTVAAVDGQKNNITLVIRKQAGPLTTHLANTAVAHSTSATDTKTTLSIEPPRGAASKNFSELLDPQIQRILLVAGGVGATFILPIYKAIIKENPAARVQVIWAIRSAAEATWATSAGNAGETSILDDDRVQLFVTGNMAAAGDPEGDGEAVEMGDLRTDERRRRHAASNSSRRPDLQKIVDDTFKQGSGEKVAVLVCGPTTMARELRDRVRPWVMQGRDVWWHDESFGW